MCDLPLITTAGLTKQTLLTVGSRHERLKRLKSGKGHNKAPLSVPLTTHRVLVTRRHPSSNPCCSVSSSATLDFSVGLQSTRKPTYLQALYVVRSDEVAPAPPLAAESATNSCLHFLPSARSLTRQKLSSTGESSGNSSSLNSFHKMEIYSTRALVGERFRARGAVKQ